MPYIPQKRREEINDFGTFPQNAGELNYLITNICHGYIIKKGLCYANLNEVVGALECCKLEIYRQIAAPYEDKKKKESGPVSELDK